MVVHAYNPSYLEDRYPKDHSLKIAWAKSVRDLILTNKPGVGLAEWLK
jgi:hypothetical protein